MVSIKLNLGNKTFYTLLAVISVLVLGGFVIAYTQPGQTADPAIHGHTADEIDGLPSGGTTCVWKLSPNQLTTADFIANKATGSCYFTSGTTQTAGYIGSGSPANTNGPQYDRKCIADTTITSGSGPFYYLSCN